MTSDGKRCAADTATVSALPTWTQQVEVIAFVIRLSICSVSKLLWQILKHQPSANCSVRQCVLCAQEEAGMVVMHRASALLLL